MTGTVLVPLSPLNAPTEIVQPPCQTRFKETTPPASRAVDISTPWMTEPTPSNRLDDFLKNPFSEEQKAYLETMKRLSEETAAIADAIERNVSMKRLEYITSSRLEDKEKDKNLLLCAIKAIQLGLMPGVQALRISGGVPLEIVQAISETLKACGLPGLKVLKLSDTHLGPEGVQALSNALQTGCAPDLAILELDHNRLGSKGVRAFSEALKAGGMPRLQWLRLGEDLLSTEDAQALGEALKAGGAPGLQRLSAACEDFKALTRLAEGVVAAGLDRQLYLEVWCDGIGYRYEKASDIVQEALNHPDGPKNPTIAETPRTAESITSCVFETASGQKKLDLRGDRLDPEGVRILSETLRTGCMSGLQVIDLKDNALGSADMRILSEALKSGCVSGLQKLDLRDNYLGPKGARILSETLQTGCLPELRVLRIACNHLGSEGVRALSEAVKSGSLPKLQVLDLSSFDKGSESDDIGSEGIALIQTLKTGGLSGMESPVFKSEILNSGFLINVRS